MSTQEPRDEQEVGGPIADPDLLDEDAAQVDEAFERMVAERAELSAEERAAGSDAPEAQARTILEDSELRALEREVAPMTAGERRTSDEAIPPR